MPYDDFDWALATYGLSIGGFVMLMASDPHDAWDVAWP